MKRYKFATDFPDNTPPKIQILSLSYNLTVSFF